MDQQVEVHLSHDWGCHALGRSPLATLKSVASYGAGDPLRVSRAGFHDDKDVSQVVSDSMVEISSSTECQEGLVRVGVSNVS